MQQGSGMEMIFILIVFGAIFYFMIYRPQAKRQKQQRELLAGLAKGDEVLTNGGLIGKITKVAQDSDSIVIGLNETTEVTINRGYVVAVLPKGSIKSL